MRKQYNSMNFLFFSQKEYFVNKLVLILDLFTKYFYF